MEADEAGTSPGSRQYGCAQQGELLTWSWAGPSKESSGFIGDAVEPLSSATLLEPPRPRQIHRTPLCRCDPIVQQADSRDHTHHAFLAASLAQLGNSTAGAAHAREVIQREPAFTAQGFLGTLTINNIRIKSTCVTGL